MTRAASGAAPATGCVAVDALLDLVAWLPPFWDWSTVRPLRISVRDEDPSSVPLVVWVDGGWFVVELEPGDVPERLAPIGAPAEAIAALRRLFEASALVAVCMAEQREG